MARLLDYVFFLYFASHIPASILVDFQSLLPSPSDYYPQTLIDVKLWYCEKFRDSMMMIPPVWFKSLLLCELFLQFPTFPIFAYGFFKGAKKCPWLRIPAIVYGAHVATSLVPIFAYVMFHDFSAEVYPGPKTLEDRLCLISIYTPYFLIPLLLVIDGVVSSAYLEKSVKDHNQPSAEQHSKKTS